jgi:hypothetical protein
LIADHGLIERKGQKATPGSSVMDLIIGAPPLTSFTLPPSQQRRRQDMNLSEAQWLAYGFPYRRFAVALADDRARRRIDADRSGRIETLPPRV